MRSWVPTPAAAAVAVTVGGVLFVEIVALWENVVAGGAISTATTAWLLLSPPPGRGDHDRCADCAHLRIEHHGICQACQRDVVARRPGAPQFACENFEADTRTTTPPSSVTTEW